MTPREAFKYGFLRRCAEERLDDAATAARIEKAAAGPVDAAIGWLAGKLPTLAKGTAATLVGMPIAALGAGGVAGVAAGHGLASMADPGYTPDDVNHAELLDAFDSLTRELEARRKAEGAARAHGAA